jgi:hypothetical protein
MYTLKDVYKLCSEEKCEYCDAVWIFTPTVTVLNYATDSFNGSLHICWRCRSRITDEEYVDKMFTEIAIRSL